MDAQLNERSLKSLRTNKSLKRLRFDGVNWTKKFIDEIKDLVRDVESIEFQRLNFLMEQANKSLDDILKHSPEIKNMKIYGPGRYPTIKFLKPEDLAFDLLYERIDDLCIFLQRNDTIKRIDCHVVHYSAELMKQLLISISRSNVEECFLDFHYPPDVDFTSILHQLKMLDQRNNFKRLEISGKHWCLENVDLLASIKSLKGFHLKINNKTDTSKLIAPFSSLVNLTVLDVSLKMGKKFAESVSQSLVNLMELYYRDLEGSLCEDSVETEVLPFVTHCAKLVKMFLFSGVAKKGLQENIAMYCTERAKLPNAARLIINFDFKEVGFDSCADDHYSGLKNGLVTIQQVRERLDLRHDRPNPLFSVCYD